MSAQGRHGKVGSASNNRIAGGLESGQSYRLDGAESQSERRNDPAFNAVSVEALQELPRDAVVMRCHLLATMAMKSFCRSSGWPINDG